MDKLFVGSLGWDVTTEDLVEAFQVYGELDLAETKVITDRETGKSRGFGFVKYLDPSKAEEALNNMNGASIQGRAINVSFAKPREEGGDRRPRFGGGNRGGFNRN